MLEFTKTIILLTSIALVSGILAMNIEASLHTHFADTKAEVQFQTKHQSVVQQLSCNLTATATASPSVVCEQSVVTLSVTSNEDILNVQWTPSIVDNPNSTTTSATISATTTFGVDITSLDDQNLIINGDFSNGLNDFSSDYVPGTGGGFGLLTNEGQFAVATDASTTHNNFAACSAPSNNGGNILVVNGAGVLNQDIWCQTINVFPNTSYAFGFSLTAVTSDNPAQLQVSINNNLLGNIFTASTSTCNWLDFSQEWATGAATVSAEICITNQNTSSGGNDFALADLFFSEICTANDQVTVTLEELNAEWTPPVNLCPNATDIILDNLLSNTASLNGTWTIDGQETAIFSAQVSGTGAFLATYTVNTATCTESSSNFIIVNPLPDASWTNPSPLSINAADIDLNDLLTNTAFPGGTWTIDGSPSNIFPVSTLGIGDYLVQYAVGNFPCENESTQIITIADGPCDAAEVSVTPVPTICLTPDVEPFDLTATAVGAPGASIWSGTGITNIQNGTFNPQLAGVGTHTIIHTYVTIDCNVLDSIEIEIIAQPVASFSALDVVCISDTLEVMFDGIASPNAVYNWNFFDANVISGTGAGPYDLQWDTSGIHLVQLSVTDGACSTNPFFANIQIDAVLDTPIIECFSTFSSVSYEWNPIENSTAYVISVINGGPLGMITSDTSYLLPDLVPGQTVNIRMVVVSNNSCPGSINLPVCTSTYCPDSVNVIVPFGPICIGNGLMDTLALMHNIPDSLNEFTAITWSGLGVTDSTLIIDESMLGTNEIYVFLDHEACAVYDTFTYEVISGPVVDFELPDSTCLNDTIAIIFTGTTTPGTTFNWNLEGGIIANTGDGDTLQVYWSTDSIKNVSLQLIDEGCGTEERSQQIEVQAPLEAPVLICEATLSEVLFTWESNSLATSADVNVLQGLAGILTTDTSYLIQNLAPEQEVEIEVVFISPNACENAVSTITCAALPCPEVILSIAPITPICYEQIDTLQLLLADSVGIDTGLLYWSGTGIIDSITGLFLLDTNRIGQENEIIAIYEDGVCVFSDTISITILEQSTAFFTLVDSTCLGDTIQILYTGATTENATFNWSLDGGVLASLNDTDSLLVYWETGGIKNITLEIADPACGTAELTQQIEIQTPIEAPMVSCESSVGEILFTWLLNPLVTDIEVNVLQGPTGILVTDTSYLVFDLQPEQEVEIAITFISPNSCQNSSTSILCTTLPCPDVTIEIAPIVPICFTENDTLTLALATSIGVNLDSLHWSGTGIIDSGNGLFLLDTSRVGQNNEIIVSYTEGICIFSDTILIEINQQPTAIFEIVDTLCLGDTTNAVYTGNTTGSATFNWTFENANISTATGIGSHELFWENAGDFEISLIVEENNCTADTFTDTINIIPPLEITGIECNPTLTNIAINWSATANATGYELNLEEDFAINWLSDTSILIENLLPATTLNFTLVALSNQNCENPAISFSCTTESCSNIAFDWAADNEIICSGDQTVIHFSITSNDNFNITLVSGIDTSTFTDIINGDSLVITPSQSINYSIIEITNESASFCTPILPEIINITVNEPLEAGEALPPIEMCSGTDNLILLNSLITNFQNGGTWAETSTIPSSAGAFDASAGSLSTVDIPAGTYLFEYTLSSPAPCPSDNVEVEINIHPTPIADAGDDLNLGCLFNEGSIGSSNTTTGSTIDIIWTSQNGTPIANPTEAIIDINQADTYFLIVTDTITGCTQNDEVTVISDIVFLIPYASVSNLSCFGMNDGIIRIDSIIGGTPPYLVSFEEGDFTSQMVFGSLSAGNYHLFIIDANGCQSELNLDLTSPSQLIVQITSNIEGDEQTIDQGDELILNAIINRTAIEIDTIVWNPDTLINENLLQITDYPFITSTYGITVTDEFGCSASDYLTIFVSKERHVFIPNSFSPNDDGINDLLMIYAGKGVKSVKTFNIFNRWGELIFSHKNFQPNDNNFGWNGKFNGKKLNPAVFVYAAEIEMLDGEIVIFKGEVTLIR